MVNNNIPLCKYCIHNVPDPYPTPVNSQPDTCNHEKQRQLKEIERKVVVDPVDGRETRGAVSLEAWCYRQRLPSWPLDILEGKCGRRGRFFELKKPDLIPFCGDPEDDPNPPDFEDYV
jgi:hypothetical protein